MSDRFRQRRVDIMVTIMQITNHRKGFSLLEVLIFISILSVFFVVTASIVTFMLRAAKINERKLIATRYAEEVMEWIRAERDIDWNQFVLQAQPGGTTVWCFNSATLSWNSSPCLYTLDAQYKRTARLFSVVSAGAVYQVNVDVNVEWLEGGKTYSVPINSTLSIWER